MSASEAQKSPVHQATEDSNAEPTNVNRAAPGTAAGGAPGAGREDIAADAAELKARPDTAMGVPGNFERGAATAGLRPDDEGPPATAAAPGVTRDDVAVGKDPDESTYGGPLKIDDPDAS